MTNWVDIADKTRLRATARDLRRLLRETVVAAKANENILAALHEIALVLIAGDAPASARRRIDSILRRRLQIDFCEWIRFDAQTPSAVRRAAPGGVRPLIAARASPPFLSAKTEKAKSFCALSLFRAPGSRVRRGVLILTARHENAFSNVARADLLRRLAEMLAAADGSPRARRRALSGGDGV